ncbi:MAG: FtsX-like permease family protein [Bacteroidales bacterium]
MILHYFKHTLRLFSRNGVYSIINLLGLSIGLAVGIIILMIIGHQLSYDRFHRKGKDIFQVSMVDHSEGQTEAFNTIPAAVGPSLWEQFPEILSVTRISAPVGGFLTYGEQTLPLQKISWVDSTFFQTFSFRLLEGNPEQALAVLYGAVLTEKTAAALFGDANPMGQTIRLNNAQQYVVTGIVKDPPAHSHIQFDVLLSFSALYEDRSLYMGWDGGNRYVHYLLMSPSVDWPAFHAKLPAFLYEKINQYIESYGFHYALKFFPLEEVYLKSGHYGNPMMFVYIFGAIAVFILLIAGINFTNLSTAQALRRARETGVRKVAGASRGQLMAQYTGEALLIALGAALIALLLVELVHPFINAMTGMELKILSVDWPPFLPLLVGMVLLTGVLAGSYPAFYLSSFQPVQALRGSASGGRGKAVFSKALVVLQFVISMTLIHTSIVVFRQLDYMYHFDPGMNTRDVLWLRLPSQRAMDSYETLRNEISSLPGVEAIGATSEIPGRWVTSNGYTIDDAKEASMIHVMDIDPGLLDVLGIEVVAGRNFAPGSQTDKTTYLVNETFIRQFGIDDFQAVRVHRDGSRPIIGVVKDFHFASLHHPVKPLILTNDPYQGHRYVLIRINPNNKDQLLAQVQTIWRSLLPGDPFLHGQMGDYLEQSYDLEKQVGQVFSSFTLLLVLIACIGLFGLSSLMIRQRQKEIGLRKLLGAPTWSILKMVTGTYTWLVILANLIAIMPVYFIVRTLLGFYSYSIELNLWWFVLTALGSLLLAWTTVGWQSWSISQTNPAEVIRCE